MVSFWSLFSYGNQKTVFPFPIWGPSLMNSLGAGPALGRGFCPTNQPGMRNDLRTRGIDEIWGFSPGDSRFCIVMSVHHGTPSKFWSASILKHIIQILFATVDGMKFSPNLSWVDAGRCKKNIPKGNQRCPIWRFILCRGDLHDSWYTFSDILKALRIKTRAWKLFIA